MEDIKYTIEAMMGPSNRTLSNTHLRELEKLEEPYGHGKILRSSDQTKHKANQKKQGNQVESKESWTVEEELRMLIVHQEYQNRWSCLSQALKRRSNNSIKNRFYSIFRKIKNKIRKGDFTYASHPELLEAIYITSLMQQYFVKPRPVEEQNGKRGKDFIYSLLKDIRLGEIVKYREDLQKHIGSENSLEELWQEVVNKNSNVNQDMAIPKNVTLNLFSYITEPPIYEKSICTLPPPHEVQHPTTLTNEEKEFIRFQAFRNKESASAGTHFPCQMMNSPLYSPMALSTGLHHKHPAELLQAKRGYEGFTDFTEKNCQQIRGFPIQTGNTNTFNILLCQN